MPRSVQSGIAKPAIAKFCYLSGEVKLNFRQAVAGACDELGNNKGTLFVVDIFNVGTSTVLRRVQEAYSEKVMSIVQFYSAYIFCFVVFLRIGLAFILITWIITTVIH